MPRYLLLLHEPANPPKELSPEMIQSIIKKYQAWTSGLQKGGHFVGAEKLAHDGRVLRGSGAQKIIKDGPYIESKEVIGGFFIIEAKSYEQAVELLKDCPHLERGAIEVREIEQV
jgi:hypothetical protein